MARPKSGIFAIIAIISVILTASFSSVASAEILQFGPGALPTCAYECVPLWSAQYDCPGESTPGECFCTSKHLDALLQGTTVSPCEDECPETGGGAGIKIWFDSVCVAYLPKQTTSTSLPKPTSTTDSSNPTDTSTAGDDDVTTTKNSNKSNESADLGGRAVEWWKKNWHWFLIAFLIIIVPITVYALWFPCRKWTRRQIVQRRSRPSLPSLPPVDSTLMYKNPYSNGGLASPGIPPVPVGAFSNQQWADPFSPSLTRDGSGYIPHYVAPPTPSPVGAIRQESWERKVREEFEGKKTLGEKLAFWKKDRKGGEGDEEGNMER